MTEKSWRNSELRVLAFKDSIVFPNMVVPLFSKEKETGEVEVGLALGQAVFLTLQRPESRQCRSLADVYEIGVIATVLQINKLVEGGFKLLLEGLQRGRLKTLDSSGSHLFGRVSSLKDIYEKDDINLEALLRRLLKAFAEFASLVSTAGPRIDFSTVTNVASPGKIVDGIIGYLTTIDVFKKQQLLEILSIKDRIARVLSYLQYEIELLKIEGKIEEKVKNQVQLSQKEFYLSEKLKAVRTELDAMGSKRGQEIIPELDKLREKFAGLELSKEAQEKVEVEMKRLANMPPFATEASVARNYLECLSSLPWQHHTDKEVSLVEAEKILDEDHYALKKVKERILEYIAVQSRLHKAKGPILCLVGPPGVGKTSLGRSIARAVGREFVRISLGGVDDEAEIRGHRRTYIGSMPGKIIQNLTKCKVNNPLFMLDEIDKLSKDFHGDPASALLEVLDPEQNHTFVDHFLEIEYDLSNIMFIATANTLDIPFALLDRMEILRLEGYTEEEKMNIAEHYLIPKQIRENGLHPEEITITMESVKNIIRNYTQEAGVRGLERSIAKICRKALKKILKNECQQVEVNALNLEEYLGVYRYSFGHINKRSRVGEANGLAWTEVGGDLLKVEVALIPGKGKTTLTGQLGEVMQESIQAAITVTRGLKKELNLKRDFYEKNDIHLHVPEGATPKDGPSAGITVCAALISAITKIPVRVDVAMTGEITLSGDILPIGGLKEKLLAALRGGIKEVLIPQENMKDLKELPEIVTSQLKITAVKHIKEVLQVALEKNPFLKSKGPKNKI